MRTPFDSPELNTFPDLSDAFDKSVEKEFLDNYVGDSLELSQNSNLLHVNEKEMENLLKEQGNKYKTDYSDQSSVNNYFDHLQFHSPTPYRLRASLADYQSQNNISDFAGSSNNTDEHSSIVTPIKRKKSKVISQDFLSPQKDNKRLDFSFV